MLFWKMIVILENDNVILEYDNVLFWKMIMLFWKVIVILEIDNVIFTFCLLFLVGYIENLTVNSNVNEKRPQSWLA